MLCPNLLIFAINLVVEICQHQAMIALNPRNWSKQIFKQVRHVALAKMLLQASSEYQTTPLCP
jgi:hypothetical protein